MGWGDILRLVCGPASKLGFEFLQAFQSAFPTLQLPLRIWRGGHRARWFLRRELHAADVEVFFKAVGLQKVGEFERSDIAAPLMDFALKITDYFLDVLRPIAQPEQFVPHAFPIKAQAECLAGELTVELMGLADLLRGDGGGHAFHKAGGACRPGAQGTWSIAF